MTFPLGRAWSQLLHTLGGEQPAVSGQLEESAAVVFPAREALANRLLFDTNFDTFPAADTALALVDIVDSGWYDIYAAAHVATAVASARSLYLSIDGLGGGTIAEFRGVPGLAVGGAFIPPPLRGIYLQNGWRVSWKTTSFVAGESVRTSILVVQLYSR